MMSPALEEKQQSSLADTGIETPEQQSTPQGGIWEAETINTGGSLRVGISFSPRVDSSSPTEKSTRPSTLTGIFPKETGVQIAAIEETAITQHRKETSDENKQFDPGGKAGFLLSRWGRLFHGLFCFLMCFCLSAPTLISNPGDQLFFPAT
jgi:hypothetical protein